MFLIQSMDLRDRERDREKLCFLSMYYCYDREREYWERRERRKEGRKEGENPKMRKSEFLKGIANFC